VPSRHARPGGPERRTATNIGITPHTEWVFPAAPGVHTYTLVAMASDTAEDLKLFVPRLTATTHPFGATGNPGTTEIDPAPVPATTP